MAFRIVADTVAAPKFKKNLAGLHDRYAKAFTASMNMAASMIKQQGDADIEKSGNFSGRWTQGFHVNVQGQGGALGRMRIVLTHDEPGAKIFEEGGVIKGKPMLWIPLSFSDAKGVRASEYPGGLFSVTRTSGGRPLLFSLTDKQPKYFGIEQVTIPRKFHLRDVQKSVMGNFRQIFDTEFKAAQ